MDNWNFHTARHVTADKLNDFLMNPKARPDLQTPEALSFLNDLKTYYHTPENDHMMPWIVKEWKKGNIDRNMGYNVPMDNPRDYYEEQHGMRVRLDRDKINDMSEWAKSQHPTRTWDCKPCSGAGHSVNFQTGEQMPCKKCNSTGQSSDIMQLTAQDMHRKIQDWNNAKAESEGRKTSGEVEHNWADGWTMQRLESPEALKEEGDVMGHCVGGYHGRVAGGNCMIYSLRDKQNIPHVTMEVTPKKWIDQDGNVHNSQFGLGDDVKLSAHPDEGEIVQIQGKANTRPKSEYQERMKAWVEAKWPNPADRPKWGSRDIEDFDDLMNHVADGEDDYGGDGNGYSPHGDYGFERDDDDVNVDWFTLLTNASEYEEDYDDIVRAAVKLDKLYELRRSLDSAEEDAKRSWIDYDFEYEFNHDPEGYCEANGIEFTEPEPETDDEEFNRAECNYCGDEGTYYDVGSECEACKDEGDPDAEDEEDQEDRYNGEYESTFDEDAYQTARYEWESDRDQFYQDHKEDCADTAWEESDRGAWFNNLRYAADYAWRGRFGHRHLAAPRRPKRPRTHPHFTKGHPCRCKFTKHLTGKGHGDGWKL